MEAGEGGVGLEGAVRTLYTAPSSHATYRTTNPNQRDISLPTPSLTTNTETVTAVQGTLQPDSSQSAYNATKHLRLQA